MSQDRDNCAKSDDPSEELPYDEAATSAILEAVLREMDAEEMRLQDTERKATTLLGLSNAALAIFLGFVVTQPSEVAKLDLLGRVLVLAILAALAVGVFYLAQTFVVRQFVRPSVGPLVRKEERGYPAARLRFRHARVYAKVLKQSRDPEGPMTQKLKAFQNGIKAIALAFILLVPFGVSLLLGVWVLLVLAAIVAVALLIWRCASDNV